jgi:hypothetical protein
MELNNLFNVWILLQKMQKYINKTLANYTRLNILMTLIMRMFEMAHVIKTHLN